MATATTTTSDDLVHCLAALIANNGHQPHAAITSRSPDLSFTSTEAQTMISQNLFRTD